MMSFEEYHKEQNEKRETERASKSAENKKLAMTEYFNQLREEKYKQEDEINYMLLKRLEENKAEKEDN